MAIQHAPSRAFAYEPPKDFFGIIKVTFQSVWALHKKEALLVIVCAIVAGALQSYTPMVLQEIINGFTSGTFASVGSPDFQTLLLIFVAAGIAGLVFKVLSEKTSFYLATQVEDWWRFTVLRKYYELPISWHDLQDSGEVASRIDRGGSAIYTIISELLGQVFFVDLVTMMFILPLAYFANQQFFIVLFLPIPILTLITFFLSQKLAEGQNRLNELDKLAQKALYDGAMNIRTVKTFGKEAEETNRYKERWTNFHDGEYQLERLRFLQTLIFTFMDVGTRGLILLVSFYLLQSNGTSLGQIVLLLSYQQLVFQPLTRLTQVFTRIRRQANRAKILLSIIDDSNRLNAKPRTIKLEPIEDEVRFRNVSFSYTGRSRNKAVDNISFDIIRGSTVAIVGRSGAGKTTVAALLAGFYTPNKGKILWDGEDMSLADRNSITKQVSYVAQDSTLFNRSIRANIAYADDHASDDDIRGAAESAHAHGFVSSMRKGYESVIGERGVRLSGGQRQRLALARALLAKGSLLILDESTSQLDSESERAIREAIAKLRGQVTQVIIAHRLSTVLHADKILVMDKGKLVASGKHRQLLKKSKIYRKLYELQFQD
jgi:subfamily B ATP-binding cassette protein MsbA